MFAVAAVLAPDVALAQPYGLDAPVAVGSYLDGVFPSETPTGDVSFVVEDAFPSFSAPPLPTALVIQSNPADDRLYVGSRDGQIISFENDPAVSAAAPFMDLRDRTAIVWDGGFLGLVFHPNFGQAGADGEFTFYAYYSTFCPTSSTTLEIDFGACNAGYPQGNLKGYFNTWLRLSKFTAFWDPVDGVWKGDSASEKPLLNIRLYNNSHRGGGPLFGLDGKLYLAIGDQFRYTTAQDIVNTLEGGVLRLEVDLIDNGDGTFSCPVGSHEPIRLFQNVTGNPDELSGNLYCIPDDNPWVDPTGSVMEEYWTLGHRNPHRMTVDPVTGRIWIGEIGENTREEVNVIEAGQNNGWPFREGLIAGPRPVPPSFIGVLTDPVIDFTRDEANSIIGGYVYRGSEFPELTGRYLAGDWVTRNVWAIDLDPATMTATKELITNFTPGGLATFGQANDGEVFLGSVSLDTPLQKLARTGAGVPDPPPFLSQIGAFVDLETLEPHPAAIPFEPLTFWSDEATKQRWIFVPNDGTHDQPDEQIVFSEKDPWDFPSGTVIMKHFELDLDETGPGGLTRLETRFLVRDESGDWYGVTYRWRENQIDADLLETGETEFYSVDTPGGGTRTQTWTFPSRDQCLQCHTSGEGGPAGPGTHQLNRDLAYSETGHTDNQLRTWSHLGLFANPPLEAEIAGFLSAASVHDASASLELRARSYLDTNCSYCHRPETGNRAAFDARLTTSLESQGLVWGTVIDPKGLSDPSLVKPGDPANSLVLHRASLVGPDMMPPLAKDLVDTEGMALLQEWIERVDPGYPLVGVVYEYYEETGLNDLPDFDALTPVETGAAGTFDISLRQRDDDFAFRFTAVVEVPVAGEWTFYTSSDEGSELWLDGTLLVDNGGRHPAAEVGATRTLSAGYHEIVVTYFEVDGPELLNVLWEGPGTPKQLVAANLLFQQQPTPIVNDGPQLSDPGAQSNYVGDVVSLALSSFDPDGDAPFFSAQGLPPGLSIEPDTGVIQGVLGAGSPGVRGVVLSVSDGPAVDSVAFDWTVIDDTDPTITLDAPLNGTMVAGTVLIQATASDAGGIAGVQFLLDGVPLGDEVTAPPYELVWDTIGVPDGLYAIAAIARDLVGNTSASAEAQVDVQTAPIAAWSFDEATGGTAADSTGNGHDGAVNGAVWVPTGYFGSALEFSGGSDAVVVADSDALDLGGAMTVSAWVYPTAAIADWAAIVQKETDAYFLHAYSLAGPAAAGITGIAGCCSLVYAPVPTPVGTWTHLAASFDGSQLTFYVNGLPVGTAATTGPIENTSTPLWIGNNSYSEGFEGLIDEVRVYDRALGEAEIQVDMAEPVGPQVPDTEDPTISIAAPAAGPVAGVVPVTALAADDSAVVGVQFLLDGAPLGVELLAPPWELLWDTSAIANGPYTLSAIARDSAGNTANATDVPVTVDNVPDATDPEVSIATPSSGATLTGTVIVSAAATDDIGVVGVQLLLDGAPLGDEDLSPPFELSWNTRLVPNGLHALSAIARDAAGNTATAPEALVEVDNSLLQPVAAWAFDETSGTTANDASGNGHAGSVSGAAWDGAGVFGGALAFDGAADAVTVPDAPGLDLSVGMTLSAWVRPAALPNAWSAILQKQTDAWFLHASSPGGLPAAGATIDGSCCPTVSSSSDLSVGVWSHVAATYDGALLAYYVDGVLAGSVPVTGLLEDSPSPLWIGNNSYGEGFAGLVDEVRIYDFALSAAEIQTDMATPLIPTGPDLVDPTIALTLPAAGTLAGAVSVTADATDDVGVVAVQFLIDGSPLGPELLSPPWQIVWDTSLFSNGPYSLSATARDAAGNTGVAADVAVEVENVPDAILPSVAITAPTSDATVSATVLVQADASDDIGVVGVQFLIDGVPVGAEDLTPPYQLSWNSRLFANGPVTLLAVARDAAGNLGWSPSVPVTIDNSSLAPVASWSFEAGSGPTAFDSSGGGHDGAVSAATWTTDGHSGGGLEFDGAGDVVVVAADSELDLDPAFTLSAWVRPAQSLSGWSAILQKETDAWFLHASSPAGVPAAGATLADVCCPSVFGPTSLPVGEWSHVAATYDGALLDFYIDGLLVSSTPTSGAVQITSSPLRIGNNTYGEGFVGTLDDVRIYNRALDDVEIRSDRDTPVPEPGIGLLFGTGALGLALLGRQRARRASPRPRASRRQLVRRHGR